MDKLKQVAEKARTISMQDMITGHAQVHKPEHELLFAFVMMPETREIISSSTKYPYYLDQDVNFCMQILLKAYRYYQPVDTNEIHADIAGSIARLDFTGVVGKFWQGAIHTVRRNYLINELRICHTEAQKIYQNRNLSLEQKTKQINTMYLTVYDKVNKQDKLTQKAKMSNTLDYITECKSGKLKFTTWGLPGLDQYMKLRKHCCYFIGALPATGKTAFAITCIIEQCRQGKRVFFWCGEMTEDQIHLRFLSQIAGIPLDILEAVGSFSNDQQAAVDKAVGEMVGWNLITICGEDMDFGEIASEIRTEHKIKPLDAAWLDYYSDILPKPQLSQAPRHEQMADVTKDIKSLKKELSVPLIVLAQLKRDAFDQRPKKTDLAESSSCERAADGILLLDRPIKGRDKNERDYWINERKVQLDQLYGKCAIVIGKNRHGKECTSVYGFNGKLMQFLGEDILSVPIDPDNETDAPFNPKAKDEADVPYPHRRDTHG